MIRLRGARHHHLKGLDLDLVPGTWTAIVGPSGSGKTSLVHDTLVAEGRRRWLAQLSGKARQRLGKVGRPELDRLDGLPLPVTPRLVGAPSHRSTVGTRSGLLDLLRLVYAREAESHDGPLTRSQFSFNHPHGACPSCDGLGTEDQVDPALLVADPDKSLRNGALVPTQPNGYTMYSQVTVEVMDTLCQAHGFSVDTPWRELTEAQRGMVFHGTDRLVVPFGKHDLASRMTWKGITARPRKEGHYKGLIPVIEDTLSRSRNANVLRFVRTVPCTTCGGRRLGEVGRTALLGGRTLPDLATVPLSRLPSALDAVRATPTGTAVGPGLEARLEQLVALDLGHLTLSRTLPTLSGGEAQRLALASLLGTELSGLLFVFDEPTLGLHPDAQPGLRGALEAVRARGNTVLTVEHDPDFVRHADRVIALGPGSGVHGGHIMADTPTAQDPLGPPAVPRRPRPNRGELWLRGAHLRNLQHVDLPVRLRAINVVLGRSGAGKSTLVMDCLRGALEDAPDQALGTLEGERPARVDALDAQPLGRTPRSTPATWTGWFDRVRKRFAATETARSLGLRAGAFAYNGKRGRCPTCEGLGVERITLHLLDDLLRPCPTCEGSRYAPEVRQIRWRGLDIAQVLQLPVAEALEQLGDDPELAPVLQALHDLGLDHLPLGQPSPTLSRGEAQRVRLATTVARARSRRSTPGLLLLDEPDRGLHPDDLQRLIAVLDQLVDAGHTVVAISHHRHLWAAADHRVRLDEGHLELHPTLYASRTSEAAPRAPTPPPDRLTLRGVATHNLQHLDLDLPHRSLVGIVGVSGAGKSSLAIGTLAAEADRRLAETLPFAVRRHLRHLPRPTLTQATGLTPTVHLRQTGPEARRHPGSTVGTALDIDPVLRLLASRAGTVGGRPVELSAAHFSRHRPEGACPRCAGQATVDVVDAGSLVTDPGRSLRDGAMRGTKTGRYLGEPGGQFLATLDAALRAVDRPGPWLDTPWSDLPDDVRDVALHGAGDVELEVVWSFQRGRRQGEHHFRGPWRGLLTLAQEEADRHAARKDADAWRACMVPTACSACAGVGLARPARDVDVGGLRFDDLRRCAVAELLSRLDGLPGERVRAVVEALRPELAPRVADAIALGLGSRSLSTPVDDLAPADRQRLRLARVLGAGLSDLTVVLDEPADGLPDEAVPALVGRLRAAVESGHTVVVVTHRPALMRAMDHLVELGPGRGAEGGKVVAQGPPDVIAREDTPTGEALRREAEQVLPRGIRPVAHLDEAGPAARIHDGRGLGRRDTVIDALGQLTALRTLFASVTDTVPARAFSFRSPAGRCPTCRGAGVEKVSLDVLADLPLPCPDCQGRRYRAEVLAVRWPPTGDHVASFLARPATDLVEPTRVPAPPLHAALQRLVALGLGGLALGRAVGTLSGGEVQRVVLAAFDPASPPTQVRLVRPWRGLHPADRPAVDAHLEHLVAHGHDVVVA